MAVPPDDFSMHIGDGDGVRASNGEHEGVIVCEIDERHDVGWLTDTLPRLVRLPGVESIDVDRDAFADAEYLQLVVTFSSERAWARFASGDGCRLVSVLESRLDRPET
ncbi:hypothetical protein SAMN05444422_10738 [Halobiforma haloterrestris]|uniref:Uncharacterized protein n=2 Tax=Natronobacterium haloterrestre TaxID=148448 RepID=A0A1I1IFM9_NATHA|nr:hypothetical protein SAMN05444422_10738 [Halobiforma haloterrestris]